MTGADNICDGHIINGKALCSQMSHGSVSIWTTAELKWSDVKANVTQIVVYRRAQVGWRRYDGVGRYIVALQDTSCGYWGKSDFQAVNWRGNKASCGAISSNHTDATLYQEDNVKPHSTRLTTDFLGQNNVHLLPWPAFSPDLSPIERLWDQLGHRVYEGRHNTHNRQQLIQTLNREWEAITQYKIQRWYGVWDTDVKQQLMLMEDTLVIKVCDLKF